MKDDVPANHISTRKMWNWKVNCRWKSDVFFVLGKLLHAIWEFCYFGDPRRPLRIIDTPGFDDATKNLDTAIIADFVEVLLIALNGQSPRLEGSLLATIEIICGMFSPETNSGRCSIMIVNFSGPIALRSVHRVCCIKKWTTEKVRSWSNWKTSSWLWTEGTPVEGITFLKVRDKGFVSDFVPDYSEYIKTMCNDSHEKNRPFDSADSFSETRAEIAKECDDSVGFDVFVE